MCWTRCASTACGAPCTPAPGRPDRAAGGGGAKAPLVSLGHRRGVVAAAMVRAARAAFPEVPLERVPKGCTVVPRSPATRTRFSTRRLTEDLDFKPRFPLAAA